MKMSYFTTLAFFVSFGSSFDFVTNRILYKLCSSIMKDYAIHRTKGYEE